MAMLSVFCDANMKPHEFVNALVQQNGGEFAVARAMGKTTFQGTLYKFCKGQVPNPTRPTAERIAQHFLLPVDAIYDEKVASKFAEERLLPEVQAATQNEGENRSARATSTISSPEVSVPPSWPLERISPASWGNLTDRQRGAIEEAAVRAMRDMGIEITSRFAGKRP
jgi:hypothetical protein